MQQYLRDELHIIVNKSSIDDVLDELGYRGYNDIDDNESALYALKQVGKFISPKRYLDKNDLKKEICEFIDFWYV